MEDMSFLTKKEEWSSLRAVKNGQVYIADFVMFTQSCASTLVDGIECLANMIHPKHYTISDALKVKFSNYKDLLLLSS